MKLIVFMIIMKTIKKNLFKMGWTVNDSDILSRCDFYDILIEVFSNEIYEIVRDALNHYEYKTFYPDTYCHNYKEGIVTFQKKYDCYEDVEKDKVKMSIELDNYKVREVLQILTDRIYDYKRMPDKDKDNISYLISKLTKRYIK